MATDVLSFRSIAKSNLPAHQKSALARWYGEARRDVGRFAAPVTRRLGSSATAGISGLLAGGALGVASANLKTGLDVHGKVPLDAIVGAAALVLSAGHHRLDALRDAGTAAVAVFGFRKTEELIRHKRAQKSGNVLGVPAGAPAVHGDMDPIVAMASHFE